MKRKIALILIAVVVATVVIGLSGIWVVPVLRDARIPSRPGPDVCLYDQPGLVKDNADLIRGFLQNFRKQFGIEFVMAIVDTTAPYTIEDYTEKMFHKWRIGRNSGDRGIFLVVSRKDCTIKMEVSYSLEEVFTDFYCSLQVRGYLEPYLEINRIGLGMQGFVEMLTNQAWDSIDNGTLSLEPGSPKARPVSRFVSGGAGVKKYVNIAGKEITFKELKSEEKAYFSAQDTPEKTLDRFIEYVVRHTQDQDVSLFTDEWRMLNGVIPPTNSGQFKTMYRMIKDGMPYRLKQKGDYAVFLFRPDAERSSPILLRKEKEGWKVDWSTMIRCFVYDENNFWYLRDNTDSPYHFAFHENYIKRGFWTFGFDDYPEELKQMKMPLKDKVAYFEKKIRNNSNDPLDYMYLGILYLIDCSIFDPACDLIEKAVSMKPSDPHLLRLAGELYIVPFHFRNAAEMFEEYIKFRPDMFGYSRLGFCYQKMYMWDEAIKCYEAMLRIEPENAHAKKALEECRESLRQSREK
jgi:tetratricopeptide (TPR) repeat protein